MPINCFKLVTLIRDRYQKLLMLLADEVQEVERSVIDILGP